MTDREKKYMSKFLSLILRHKPEAAGITLDANGWADVDALLKGMNAKRDVPITLDAIKEVVSTNDKKRFAFNGDFSKIRANQGHSINVDVELKEARPPAVLYHGTAERRVKSIIEDGLNPQGRIHVHLSTDEETAEKVGRRHGHPAILVVQAGRMHDDGFRFYLSENGVWLTDSVPPVYIDTN